MADLKDAFNRGTNKLDFLLTIKNSSLVVEYHNFCTRSSQNLRAYFFQRFFRWGESSY